MIVVSDTTPLNYLILIDSAHVLPAIFGQVYAPPAVVAELKRSMREELRKSGSRSETTRRSSDERALRLDLMGDRWPGRPDPRPRPPSSPR